MSEIKVVIFDAGGVLHESNSVVTDDLARELGLEEIMLQQIWATEIPLLGAGKIDEAEFWRQVRSTHGIRQVELAEDLLGRAFTEKLNPHTAVIDLVKALGKKGIILAVLSNTIEPHARALRNAGLYDGFDRLFLSHEVGMRKPEVEIYQHALQALNVRPNEAIFIDDDHENVEAARMLGIHGIVFTTPTQLVTSVQELITDLELDR